jgi:TusA-related sulfurtransferase
MLAWFLLSVEQGKKRIVFLRINESGKAGTMVGHHQLHLEDLPWPLSVLNFNRALDTLKPGDDMQVTLRDPDVVGNLRQLLGSLPGLSYDIKRIGETFRILVVKKAIDDNDAHS